MLIIVRFWQIFTSGVAKPAPVARRKHGNGTKPRGNCFLEIELRAF
jgi:hypothetical protein